MLYKFSTSILLFFLLSLFIINNGLGQHQDSTKMKLKKISGKIDSTSLINNIDSTNVFSPEKQLKGFIDKNANGIDDRIENKMGKGKQKGKKDKFIDQNGDGICDGRESAFGIKKAFRKRKGSRKH
ncbi:MAG: hypothetical protein JSW07_19545 [bacterium]|nr:MAG: hypothetical protein JSW07_19545 [bacterium]